MVVVRGPESDITVRRRDRVAGVWINHDAAKLSGMPAYYFLASSRPLKDIAPQNALTHYSIGLQNLQPDTVHSHHDYEPFRQAALRQRFSSVATSSATAKGAKPAWTMGSSSRVDMGNSSGADRAPRQGVISADGRRHIVQTR